MAERSSIEWTDATWNPIAGDRVRLTKAARKMFPISARKVGVMLIRLSPMTTNDRSDQQ